MLCQNVRHLLEAQFQQDMASIIASKWSSFSSGYVACSISHSQPPHERTSIYSPAALLTATYVVSPLTHVHTQKGLTQHY